MLKEREMNEDDEEMSMSKSLVKNEPESKEPDIPFCGCLSVRFYQPYFDVDTVDIYTRLMNAFFYCKRETNFVTLVEEKPDAYGPFWIATTLVFTVAVTSHISSWLSSWVHSKNWEYNFQSVVTASSLIYGFSGGVPLLIWFVLRQLEAKFRLITALCLYGYSLAVFIPATAFCLLPNFASWISLLVAAGVSSLFILRNLAPIIISVVPNPKHSSSILAAIGLVQLVFALSLKFAFYSSR